MNRRALIASVATFLSGIVPAKADADVACRLLGHQWVFDRNEPRNEPPPGWWWEFFKCKRCGAERRELVASPRG